MFADLLHRVYFKTLLQGMSVLLAGLALIWCASNSFAQDGQRDAPAGKSIPVTRLVVTYGTNSSPIRNSVMRDEQRIVIRDRVAWENLWQRILQPNPSLPPLPEIDFSKEMLIVVAMGDRPTSGYAITVTSAREQSNRLEVEVEKTFPCGMQMQVLTAPIDIVRIPTTDLLVTFREVEVKRRCN